MDHLALGLMSGTSCDGISAALVELGGGSVLRVIAQRTWPYPEPVAEELRRAASLRAPALSRLNMELGERLARAALRLLDVARLAPPRVEVIGSHGHTIYHGPDDAVPSTLQLGEPAIIAERTGIAVVANFRPRDLAAGGAGAPLVPCFDAAHFGAGRVRALLNLGGIANVTVVGRGIRPIAFDTGPGNCLIDLVAWRATGGRRHFDPAGHLARRGRIDPHALERLWRHPYFRRRPPKSTGRERFNETLLRAVFARRLAHASEDVLATVTYFTAYSIAESLRRFVPYRIRELIVSGGGVRNRTLMRHLARLMSPIPVHPIERYGIPSQAKEPVAFAYLAHQAFHGRSNHLPETTGARAARVLGTLTPP